LNATKNLLEIKNIELYQKCIELKGLTILSKWLREYKVSVAGGTDLTRDEEIIVTNIICLCERIHLSINDLKTSKIGKNINSLGKALSEECQVKRLCEEIVAKWRQMIDDNEEAKNESNENNSPSQQNKHRDGPNNFSGKNNNNQFLNNKIKRNSHNPNSFSITNINPNSNIINFNTNVNNTSNKTNSIKIKTAPSKGCLKKGNSKKKDLNVHFNDLNLIEVKIFKSTDEPSAPNISQEEYMKIQEEVRKNPNKFKIEEIRKKEVTMDISQQKEPEISWRPPLKLYLEEEIETQFKENGKDSQENKYIEDLCAYELKVHYFNDIPEPIEMEKKLFSFTDETIPKIENSQKATKTNDVTIDDVFKFWDSLGNNITKENLSQFEYLLDKVIDIDNDSKQQILEQAKEKYEQENMNNQNYLAGNNININNNLAINDQRFLSMNNFPGLMNLNNLNQIPGGGGNMNLLNNPNKMQPNLEQINYLNQGIQNQVQNPSNFTQTNPQNLNTIINNNIINTVPNINPMINLPNINFTGFEQNLNVINQINNPQQQQINANRNKSNLDQRMIMESAQRMNVSKYKTKPCRNYHSSTGCTRGENCFFIHDPEYKGREIQNFDPRNYERNFPIQFLFQQGMGLPPMNAINAQMGNQINQVNQLGMNPMNMGGFNFQQMMDNPNQNMAKIDESGMMQYNNMDNNMAMINRQIMEQGMNVQGYDFNYGVGMQGQTLNQNNIQ